MAFEPPCAFSGHRVRFLLLVLFTTFYLTSYGQINKKITVNFKNTTLLEALNQINKQTNNVLLFKLEEVKSESRKINLVLQNATVIQCLTECLKDTKLSFVVQEDIIIIQPNFYMVIKRESTEPPKNFLRGVVRDENGKPLPGVGVVVKGTSKGITTDENGRYELEIPKNCVIQYIMMGMKTQEIEIKGKNIQDIIMEEDALDVGEVVVTGVFNKSRESYTGSVTTITSKSLESFRGQNMVQTLKNVDPAFNVIANNDLGSNPNAIPEISLRGNSSLPLNVEEYNAGVKSSINTPLIIMDGFEISIQKLMDYNNDDIESINILKDASATAIYGSRGANGVIVVTTKAPLPGKLRINLQSTLSLEIPDLSTYDLLNSSELLGLQKQQGLYTTTMSGDSYKEATYAARLKDVLEGADTDWLHYPVRTGITQRHNVRLEGGNEEFRWGASLGYNSLQGAMKGSKRDNFNGSVILSYNLKNVIFKNQLNIGINGSKESPYGQFSKYANMPSYYIPYDVNNNAYKDFMGLYNVHSRLGNPLYDASLNTVDQSKYTELINNFSIEWQILPELKVLAQMGISKNISESDYFLPSNHSTFNTSAYETEEGYFRRGLYRYGTGKSLSYNSNITVSYSKTFNEKHLLYAGMDYSLQNSQNTNYIFTVEGFTNENMDFLGSAMQYEENGVPYGVESTTRRIGVTGNLNYSFDSRYFADVSYRVDGSSQFGSQNRFAPFWSTGIGWNLHRENFLKNSRVVNNLRLKASFGVTGSQQFSAYQAMQTYQYYSDEKYLNRSGAYLLAVGNDQLKWQTTDQYNIGAEVGLYNGRISASFDYYYKETSDLLSYRDLPRSTGFNSYIDNIGSVMNKGFEATLNGYPVRNTEKGIIWMLSTKLAYNKNKIDNLSDAIKEQTESYKAQDVDISTLFYEGYAQNSIWAVRSLGIDPSTGKELFFDRDGYITDVWYPSAKVYCGISEPLFRGNLTSMFRYREFTFNLSFGYYWGGQVYNQTLLNKVEVTLNTLGSSNVDRRVLEERWSKPGDVTFYKGFSSTQTRATSRFVMDENVLELQSASLQYRYDKETKLKKYGLQSVLFTLSASDLFHFSTVKRERGANYPFARRVGLSVALNF